LLLKVMGSQNPNSQNQGRVLCLPVVGFVHFERHEFLFYLFFIIKNFHSKPFRQQKKIKIKNKK